MLSSWKIFCTPFDNTFVILFLWFIFFHVDNSFDVPGKKYPGWRYAYNPCTSMTFGQDDPHPGKICHDIGVGSSDSLSFLKLCSVMLSLFLFCCFSSFLFPIIVAIQHCQINVLQTSFLRIPCWFFFASKHLLQKSQCFKNHRKLIFIVKFYLDM